MILQCLNFVIANSFSNVSSTQHAVSRLSGVPKTQPSPPVPENKSQAGSAFRSATVDMQSSQRQQKRMQKSEIKVIINTAVIKNVVYSLCHIYEKDEWNLFFFPCLVFRLLDLKIGAEYSMAPRKKFAVTFYEEDLHICPK